MNDHSFNICALVLKMLFTLEGEFGREFLILQGFDQKNYGASLYSMMNWFCLFWGGGGWVNCPFNSKTEYGGCSGEHLVNWNHKRPPRTPQRLNASDKAVIDMLWWDKASQLNLLLHVSINGFGVLSFGFCVAKDEFMPQLYTFITFLIPHL